jgi:plasmid stabilization system protein ParE
MARVELVPGVLQDFDRFFDHMAKFDMAGAPERIDEIVQAVQVLAVSPLIGRSTRGGRRELVIGTGTRGYVALYRYVSTIDTVFVLAFRSQREAGFKRRR